MKRASVRDVQLKTSGKPRPSRRMPIRERLIARLPKVLDTGRILEEDRT